VVVEIDAHLSVESRKNAFHIAESRGKIRPLTPVSLALDAFHCGRLLASNIARFSAIWTAESVVPSIAIQNPASVLRIFARESLFDECFVQPDFLSCSNDILYGRVFPVIQAPAACSSKRIAESDRKNWGKPVERRKGTFSPVHGISRFPHTLPAVDLLVLEYPGM
jgi:hypothetical protein